MFCPKCGHQLPDNAKFCSSCGNKFESNISANQTNPAPVTTGPVQSPQMPQAPKKKSKKLLITIIILAAVVVALIAGLLVYLFVFSDNGGSNNTVIEQKDNTDPRTKKFNEVVNQYEQSLAWYKSNNYYTDNSYRRDADEGIKAFITDMKRCYSYFANFTTTPEKYTYEDVDNDGNKELIVQDKAGSLVTYFYDDKNNTIKFSNVGDSKNNTTKDKLKNGNPEWKNLRAADMHIKLSGTIKIQDSKERAKDPNAKCQAFEYNGEQERKQMLETPYSSGTRFVIIDLDERQEFPVQQLVSVFPHKVWSIILAYDKDWVKAGHEKDFGTFSNYDGKHVQIDLDLTECDAPSGVTGYGNNISTSVDSKCICND